MHPKLRSLIVVWLAIYPSVLGAMTLLRPVTGEMPLPVQVLIMTAIVVPFVFLVLVPLINRSLARWVQRS